MPTMDVIKSIKDIPTS